MVQKEWRRILSALSNGLSGLWGAPHTDSNPTGLRRKKKKEKSASV